MIGAGFSGLTGLKQGWMMLIVELFKKQFLIQV